MPRGPPYPSPRCLRQGTVQQVQDPPARHERRLHRGRRGDDDPRSDADAVDEPAEAASSDEKEGVAGTFYKGSKGPVFNVMAGKQGGNAEQPWVKQKLRQELGVSMLEVVTDGAAEMEEATRGDAPSGGSSSPPVVGWMRQTSAAWTSWMRWSCWTPWRPRRAGGFAGRLGGARPANLQAFLARKAQVAAAFYALEDHPHKAHLREDILAGEEAIHAAQIRAESGLPGRRTPTRTPWSTSPSRAGRVGRPTRRTGRRVRRSWRPRGWSTRQESSLRQRGERGRQARGPPDRDYAAAEARLQEILKAVRVT